MLSDGTAGRIVNDVKRSTAPAFTTRMAFIKNINFVNIQDLPMVCARKRALGFSASGRYGLSILLALPAREKA